LARDPPIDPFVGAQRQNSSMTLLSKIACGCFARVPCDGRRRRRAATSPSPSQLSLPQEVLRHASGRAAPRELEKVDLSDESLNESSNLPSPSAASSRSTPSTSSLSRRAVARWSLALRVARIVLLARRSKQNSAAELDDQRKETSRASIRVTRTLSDPEISAGVRQMMALLEPGQPLGHLSDFAKEYGTEAFCKRLLRKHDGNVKKASEKFKQALVWRQAHKEVLISRKFALGGDERVIGSDLQRRPVIYMCMKNQILPGAQCSDHKVVTMLQAIDSMPGGVENMVHIWDLHGQQFRLSDLNPAPLVRMIQSQEAYFAARLHETIIIGMPRMATALKDAVWPLVPEKTKAKIRFMSEEEAQLHIETQCDEEVAGRILAAMQQNRDNRLSLEQRKKSWMRVDEFGQLVPMVA